MEKTYLQEKIRVIEDKRHQGYVEHKLSDVLIIIMSAILCGLDGLAEIMEHAQNRIEFFKNSYGISEIPSKPTVSRIAVDGKAIRSTSKEGKAHSALQILAAYLT